MSKLLSPKVVAERLGVSRRTVFAMLARNDLRRVRIGGATRIREADLARLIADGATPRSPNRTTRAPREEVADAREK
jgi:excisionase family DNA binding protein